MVKAIGTILITLLITFSFCAPAIAGDTGNKRKGKYTYRKVYKACFERGAVDSKKPHINPSDKTMDEWTRVFEGKDFEQFGCDEEWSQLSEKDLADIYSYLHAHGSDSPTPAKCK